MPARVELGIHGHALVTVAAWDPHIPATVSLDFLPPEAVTRLRVGDTEVVVEVVTDLGATNAVVAQHRGNGHRQTQRGH